MVKSKDYVAGWLDSSIHDFLQSVPESKSTRFALITSIDSNPDVRSLLIASPEFQELRSIAVPKRQAVLLPTSSLKEAESSHRLFFGFDELWLFPNDDVEFTALSGALVGPGRIDQPRLERLAGWMGSNNCSLGLGDGEGLNFVVKARGLTQHLIAHSIEQPEPSRGAVAAR